MRHSTWDERGQARKTESGVGGETGNGTDDEAAVAANDETG